MEDGTQRRVVVGFAVQQQQAGLRGNENSYLVSDLKTAATLEPFLGQKNMNVGFQLAGGPTRTIASRAGTSRREPIARRPETAGRAAFPGGAV